MYRWRLIEQTWCCWPAKPIGLIEMIGGSYLATTPQVAYKRLLESLTRRNIAIHTWMYIPSLDHQSQAIQAWKNFRKCKERLEARVGTMPFPIRMGHSLGCKLHLLAPDSGRNSQAFIGLCFNNFNAGKSIPMLGKVTKKFNIRTEFSPSPKQTIELIKSKYVQPDNLLIKFNRDKLDQTYLLFNSLKARSNDQSRVLELEGDHLTPTSTGIKKNILGDWLEDNNRIDNLDTLINTIAKFFPG
ncbi:DUF1350 family protein [Prochlorococcus marinus]|uniref:DUF1350 family protein n=1 Tax=Prochlorococcus marinus TaxID=1219 RepID=UPI0022B3E874|nr:DUF1350 family protein [Prochlorococcus marinus]